MNLNKFYMSERFPSIEGGEQESGKSWVETLLVPKLQEAGGKQEGSVRAPYQSGYRFFFKLRYSLQLTHDHSKNPYYLHCRTVIENSLYGNGLEDETFAVAILGGKVHPTGFNTHDPECIQDRILYILYAAAELWDLLPEEARP